MSSLSRSIIETTLKDDFDIKRFRDFINEMFNGFSFNELSLTHQLNETERNHVKNFTFHGSFRDVNDEAIDVLTVELQTGFKIDRARNFQRNLIGKYLKANIEGVNNAIVAFYSSDDENWRLSFVEIDRKITEKGVKTEVETPPKRFSFLVGKSEPSHTAQKQFIDVLAIQTKENLLVDTIRKAFSVEKVTKEFYIEIAKLFTDLVGGERKINNQTFSSPGLIKYPGNNDTEKKEFAVRLIGRLLFCWFLKKKKSSNNLPLLTDEILSSGSCLQFSDYYHEILEPLFFEVLNTSINDRRLKYKQGFWLNVPFLNGGLFEPHDKDYYELDNVLGKSKALNTLKVPGEWLSRLLKLFELYNFTIDESASIDIDLAIDPEMLGRVFENLLAEINPETGETARKQTGSFYTPRPIVEYMVDESLIAYLEQKLEEKVEQTFLSVNSSNITQTGMSELPLSYKLRKLISYSDEEHNFSVEEVNLIIDALDKVKILDPACGSGAFPMGVLQKIQLILEKIDPNGEMWLEKVLKDIKEQSVRKMLERKLRGEKELVNFTRKLGIIQKSIYGVDIQEIAIEISKLRCFLSIIVDEKVNDDEENRGIQPLPNLEFKFVAANTLIALPKINWGNQLFNIDAQLAELKEYREEFFQSWGEAKRNAEQNFIKAQKKIASTLFNNRNIDKEMIDFGTKLADWDPFKNTSASWFDPEWMFGVKDGFDIVIGNPPYIQLQKAFNNNKKYADLYKNNNYQTFERTGDIYCLFYEKGIQLLKENGLLTYITSNKWMRAGYGEKLREFFIKYNPLQLVDLGPGVFENATVDTNILLIKKVAQTPSSVQRIYLLDNAQTGASKLPFFACTLKSDFKNSNDLANYINTNKIQMPKISKDAWFIGSDAEQKLKEKIERIGKPLKDWDVNIYYGIKTGLNEAFIITTEKRNEILANCKDETERRRTEAIIKPILRGRDIKRYHYEWAGLWVIFIPWHFPLHEDSSIQGASEKAEKEFQKQFPSIYNHLLQFKDALSKRNKEETGIRYEWYALQRCAATYYPEFEKEKVVWQRITQEPTFCLVKPNLFVLDSMAFFTGNNLKYIMAVLNSKIIYNYVNMIVHQYGFTGFRLSNQYVEVMPLSPITPSNEPIVKQIEALVDKILEAKKANPASDTSQWEKEIDELVYGLYGLTEEEVRIIEEK